MRVAILTISDLCSRGEREDASGAALWQLVTEQLQADIIEQRVVRDEVEAIASTLRRWCDVLNVDCILTTGGTGLAPRDLTPEATRQVIEREAPGIAEAMRVESMRATPFGMLSRGLAGVRGRTLIINFPGSPKAVRECFAVIAPVLGHAVALLREQPTMH